MSLPRQRRTEVERNLVARHAQSVGLPNEDAWLAYRAAVLFWSMRIVVLTARRLETQGPNAAGLQFVLHRCAQAAVDLETATLLD